MPKYFFNISGGEPLIHDRVGADLPDMDAAVARARRKGEQVVSGLIERPELFRGLRIEITDAAGTVLQEVELPNIQGFAR